MFVYFLRLFFYDYLFLLVSVCSLSGLEHCTCSGIKQNIKQIIILKQINITSEQINMIESPNFFLATPLVILKAN